jgi:peptide/nickel transport system substrate-binding protein
MDPAIAVDSQSGLAIRNVYERLVEPDPRDAQRVIPGLARRWTISRDSLTYTFFLRKGVRFHDGTPLTAQAARFSIQRALAIGKGDSFKLKDRIDPRGIRAIGPLTLRIKLARPYAPTLRILSFWNIGSIVSPAAVRAHATSTDRFAETWMRTHMVGTGAFRFGQWQPRQFVQLVRYDRYWKGRAKLNQVIFRLVGEPAAERLMIERGEVDIIHNLPTDLLEALRGKAGVRIARTPGLETVYWVFNRTLEPFDDRRVRQAFSYAVDYGGLLRNIVKNGGIRMRGPLPRGLPFYNAKARLYQRNLALARSLLTQAGFPNGLSVPMIYPDFGNVKPIAQVLQANLADIGVRVELREVPLGTLVQAVTAGTAPFFPWVATPTYADPDAVLYPKFASDAPKDASGNVGRYSNPTVDRLLNQARSTTNNAVRGRAYRRVQEIVANDAAWIFIYQSVLQQPVRTHVTGYVIPVIGQPDFWLVNLRA